jgi:hypothetical protein|tara:strand:+ start:3534 stop:4766 length:1233 start_codon:yes stop_codon:yes gene_type:complete
MAQKEEPIANDDTGKIKVKAKTNKQPDGNETKGNVTKVMTKMKKPMQGEEETVTKVDLNKPPTPEENETKEDNADNSGVVASAENADAPQEQEEVQSKAQTQETPVLEEITGEEVEQVEEQVEEAIAEAEATGKPLPENIQKLVEFIDETGGDINDYVKLNQDYSEMDNQDLLHEFYKKTKPHLNAEEINFLMEDTFSYDEDVDDEKEIRKKKIAMKEQVAGAKTHLDGLKSKYYEDIKMGSKLTSEQQSAIDFFNRYNKESEVTKAASKKNTDIFAKKTEQVFNDKFKGFEYNVGEKKFRFNVNNATAVKDTQGDINNFVKKFLNKDNEMSDAKGYHKSLYTAMNADAIAKHFYEQGQADAMQDSVANSKNIDMNPRQSHGGEVTAGGLTVKVLGDSSSDYKFKIRKNK